MNGLARLLVAVVMLLCLCPVIYPEPIRLMPDIDWSASTQFRLQCVRVSYPFNALGTEVLIDTGPSPVADCPLAAENTVTDYTVSLEQLLQNLVYRGRSNSGTNTESSATTNHPENTPGFYNPETYRAEHEAQLLISLEVLFSLPGGPLFLDPISDPLSRFTARPGIASQTAFPVTN